MLIQGQLGELLLFHFIQHCMHAIPLLRKMSITTSANHERFGADAIHYKIENGKHIMIFGEAKTYTSSYKFNEAFEDALDSIINTYNQRRKELKSYVHEDFLDDELNKVAEDYLNNELNPVEVHLVSLAVWLYLFPQIANHSRNARMATIAVHVPNSFKNLCPSEDNARIGSKEYKGAVFKAGKADVLSVTQYLTLVLSDFQSRK